MGSNGQWKVIMQPRFVEVKGSGLPMGFGKTVLLKSPAKLNLYLSVVGKRQDGYHLLNSIMVPLELHDDIVVALKRSNDPKERRFFLSAPASICSEGNILYKTWGLFLDQVDRFPYDCFVRLRKRIPLGGGLGGGSSNAAAFLRYLNATTPTPLSDRGLIRLGKKIGADVPFFIVGKSALVSGIGEKVKPITLASSGNRGAVSVVLINPGFEVSTKAVFRLLKRDSWHGKTRFWRGLDRSRSCDLSRLDAELFVNDLEGVVFRRHPEIRRMRERLAAEGAWFSRMTGSGGTVFGVFRYVRDAKRAVVGLRRSLPKGVWVCQTAVDCGS